MQNSWVIPLVLTIVWNTFWGYCYKQSAGKNTFGDGVAVAFSVIAMVVGTLSIWAVVGIVLLISLFV